MYTSHHDVELFRKGKSDILEASVIIPIYNVENYINRCVDSVLNQTFDNFELILVDDGSTDNCGKICDDYSKKDKRVTVVHKANGGVSSACNMGLTVAQGNYVMFLDGDDYITDDCLSVLMDQKANDNTDMIIGTIMWVNECNGNVVHQVARNNEVIAREHFQEKIPQLLEERRLNYRHAKLYRMDIIKGNSLCFEDYMLTFAEDTVFNFSFLRFCKSIALVGKPVHFYMQHSNTLAHKFYADRYEKTQKLHLFMENMCKESDLLNDAMVNTINHRRISAATWCMQAVLNHSNLKTKNKIQYLTKIYEDKNLRKAMESSNGAIDDELSVLMSKGCHSLIRYVAKKRFKCKIKTIIIKLMPAFIKKILKICEYREKAGDI